MRDHGRMDGSRGSASWLAAGLLGLLFLCPPTAGWAGTMYTYEDETGALVMTDHFESIPPQFRHKAQRIEQEDRPAPSQSGGLLPASSRSRPAAGISVSRASGGAETTVLDRFWRLLPDRIVPGMTKYQSVLLIAGFILGAICFAALTLSRNPGVQFAMKWALMLVAGATFYGLYFAEMGTNLSPTGEPITNPRTVLDQVRTQAKDLERIQKERMRGMERLEQIEEPDDDR